MFPLAIVDDMADQFKKQDEAVMRQHMEKGLQQFKFKAMKPTVDKTKNDLAAMRKRLDALKAGYAAESVELEEGVIDQVKDIVAKKQAKKISGVMVDMFTASAISQIYDKVNDANKAKMDKLPITKLADVAMKMMKRESAELDEAKQVLAHGGKGQYKIVSDGGAISVMFKGKVVGKGDFDRGADSFFISMKGQKGQKSFDDAQDIADYFAKMKIKEEDEQKSLEEPFISELEMARDA